MTVKELSKRISALEGDTKTEIWHWEWVETWDYACRADLDAAIAEIRRKDPHAGIIIVEGKTRDEMSAEELDYLLMQDPDNSQSDNS
jgi:hypothetical protein